MIDTSYSGYYLGKAGRSGYCGRTPGEDCCRDLGNIIKKAPLFLQLGNDCVTLLFSLSQFYDTRAKILKCNKIKVPKLRQNVKRQDLNRFSSVTVAGTYIFLAVQLDSPPDTRGHGHLYIMNMFNPTWATVPPRGGYYG